MDTPHPTFLTPAPRLLSPGLAVLFSLMPGLGHVYVGAPQIGLVRFAVFAASITLLNAGLGGLEPMVGLFLPFFWGSTLLDAYQRAQRANRRALAPSEDGPEEAPSPLTGLLGGIALIACGVIALLHHTFGFTLAWLERGWPALFILAGAGIVWHSLRNRPRQEAEPDPAA